MFIVSFSKMETQRKDFDMTEKKKESLEGRLE